MITSESFDPSLEMGVYSYESHEQWCSWRQSNPWFGFLSAPKEIAEYCKVHGIKSSWFGQISPADVEVTSSNYRESLMGKGFNPRQRAILEVCQILTKDREAETSVYAAEGITSFARALRDRYPLFVGSEYAPTSVEQARIAPVIHQDLAALTFENASFDLCITNDVIEHLPNLKTSLSELRRVLRPGGSLLSTFPFLHDRFESIIKARLRADGSIDYLSEPEYHGNPVDPSGGSLVFQIPGWDILEDCRKAGFVQAKMILLCSLNSGITSKHYPGILLLLATT